jgi:hypothetical protein
MGVGGTTPRYLYGATYGFRRMLFVGDEVARFLGRNVGAFVFMADGFDGFVGFHFIFYC